MKKNFLFLMSALVLGMMMMTSCKKDDVEPLTGIRVSPESIQLPVGESQKVTATAIPDNATGVSYEWTSSDENVATVSDGTVTVTGLGTATVTVKSGTITKDVPVTGTLKSLTVADSTGAAAGMYVFANGGDPVEFPLTATLDPAGSGVKPEWSVDVSTVTVAASSDGLSAIVSIKGEGMAVVSVSAGGLTATYTISTSSPLDAAKGYWTFDDPNDLFKATIGQPLIPDRYEDATEEIAPVEGPSANNGAASIPKYTWLKVAHGIAANGVHQTTFEEGQIPRVNEYTLMFDVKVEQNAYYVLFQNHIRENLVQWNEASFYLKSNGRLGGGSFGNSPNDAYTVGNWHRVVVSCKFAEEGWYDYFVDGKHIVHIAEDGTIPEHTGTAGMGMVDSNRFAVHPAGILFFADTRKDEVGEALGQVADGYDYNDGLSVSGIAIWDYPLTPAEVAALGGAE